MECRTCIPRLSLCVEVESSKKPNIPTHYRDMLEEIMECGNPATHLHLQISAWHDDRKATDDKLPFGLDNVKTVLIPRQALLKKLDPLGTFSVPGVRCKIAPYVIQYQTLVFQDRPAADMDIERVLQIYKYFPHLTRQPTWGDVPIGCTCKVCFSNCVCSCYLLFASVFNLEIRVPADYNAATVSGCKKCRSIKGTAGRRRMCIIEERKCDDKKIDSKGLVLVGNHAVQVREADPVIPEPVLPSSSDNDETQVVFNIFSNFEPDTEWSSSSKSACGRPSLEAGCNNAGRHPFFLEFGSNEQFSPLPP